MKNLMQSITVSIKKSAKPRFVLAALTTCILFSSVAQADFEGLISPKNAFNWASNNDNVYILDVRTGEEWMWVGHPGPNKLVNSKKGKARGLNYRAGAYLENKVFNVASMVQKDDYSGGLKLNPDFVTDVLAEGFNAAEHTLLVICRSGKRAQAAAEKLANEEGFTTYNIDAGFQGNKNTEDYPGPDTGYRNVDGWVNNGLPWNQDKDGGYYSQ